MNSIKELEKENIEQKRNLLKLKETEDRQMNKIKNWIIGHKKTSIAIGIATVLLIAIGSIILTFNARQIADSRKQVETVDTKQKEEQLAKKVDEAKKVLDEKVENLDKLSSEDKNKLETVKKQLSEAIEKKDEQNIVKFQNELKTALNTAKINVEKTIAEEKSKAEEEKKKQEEQKAEENKPTENATVNNSTVTQPTRKTVDTGTTPASQPAEESKPAPAPEAKKEESKPTLAPEKPKERKRLGQLGNSGLEFKSFEEVRTYGEKVLDSIGSEEWNVLNEKMGFKVGGYTGWTVDYSDGSQTWTINWKP